MSWRGGDAQDAEAVFAIASITNPLGSLVAACMVEKVGFDLVDDPFISCFSEFGMVGNQRVILRHLFTHASGLRDFYERAIP